MNPEDEIIENKGKIRMNDLKIQALINILSKEGVTTKEEVENELKELLEVEKGEKK